MKQNLRLKLIALLSLVILILISVILIINFSNRTEIGISGSADWKTHEGAGFSFKYPETYSVSDNGNVVVVYDRENEKESVLYVLVDFQTETNFEKTISGEDCQNVSQQLFKEILDPQIVSTVETKKQRFVTIHGKETCEVIYTQGEDEIYAYINYHNNSAHIFVIDQKINENSETFLTLHDILRTFTFKETENTDMSTENKNNKYSSQPEILEESQRVGKTAIISTSKGDIKVKLDGEKAPLTASNFIFLSNEKFYDSLTFHRVVDGFVVQGGDPLGQGNGGPGYQLDAEHDNGLTHEVGAIAMARLSDEVNPERKSSGSQFYIVTGEASFLDGDYTVFGNVIEGMDIVLSITQGDKINSVTIE